MKKVFLFSIICLFSISGYAQALHLYGGENHDVYLGCINGSKFDENSIWNKEGQFGSKNDQNSIWNMEGYFGCAENPFCPWNENALTPPIIKDNKGRKYGYLTLNKQNIDRATFKLALELYKHHREIREDLDLWFDKIFR